MITHFFRSKIVMNADGRVKPVYSRKLTTIEDYMEQYHLSSIETPKVFTHIERHNDGGISFIYDTLFEADSRLDYNNLAEKLKYMIKNKEAISTELDPYIDFRVVSGYDGTQFRFKTISWIIDAEEDRFEFVKTAELPKQEEENKYPPLRLV